MDIQKIQEQLDEKIPRDCVSTRSGGGQTKLSYLETHYVIDRMNHVFGNLGWTSETVEMRLVSQPESKPAYIAKVRLAIFKDGHLICVKEGFGYGIDKSALNPHEMAIKEAESDAFKRAAKNLGQSMGLALYDKSQENVEETRTPNTPVASNVELRRDNKPIPKKAGDTVQSDASIDEVISSLSRVVIAKKKATIEELKGILNTEFGVDHKSKLDLVGKEKLKTKLEGMLA